MKIITAYQTKNDCYKTAKTMVPKGIVVHSTGANNPKLSRYVDCPEELGKPSSNHWNRSGVEKMVHGFIGYDKNGEVKVVNTLPYNYCCWGCGKGSKGSYNYSPAYIQFEICEDDLKNETYFNAAFDAAAEYCAYLCKTYNLSIDNVVSHAEAHARGYASNHADVGHWLKKFGKDMNWFRGQVKAKMNPDYIEHKVVRGDTLAKIARTYGTTVEAIADLNGIQNVNLIRVGTVLKIPEGVKIGDKVKIKNGVTTYYDGKKIPSWVKKSTLYARDRQTKNGIDVWLVSRLKSLPIYTGRVRVEDIERA